MARVIPLKTWRERRLMSQRELADKSGIAQSTIVRIEAGKSAQWSTIRKLLDALGMSAEEVFPDVEKPESEE